MNETFEEAVNRISKEYQMYKSQILSWFNDLKEVCPFVTDDEFGILCLERLVNYRVSNKEINKDQKVSYIKHRSMSLRDTYPIIEEEEEFEMLKDYTYDETDESTLKYTFSRDENWN